MANILQQVQTYNDSMLALMQNSYAFIGTANMRFKDFDKMTKNLGATVDMDLPPKMITTNSLVVSAQDVEQRVLSLSVDQARSVYYNFTAQEFIFNVREYMDKFGKSAAAELGAKVEANVANVAETNTYRTFGDGVTPINTTLQLANALAFFRNTGMPRSDTCGYLSDLTIPGIVNSDANQFTPKRNDRQVNSWELGNFSQCDWYSSNLLSVHTAGSEGIAGSTLTVVSVTKNADDAVTSITFSGTNGALDADSVKQHDKFTFSDGVSGQTNLRFRTFYGHEVSGAPVQFRATADAASTAGSQVTVTIDPPLKASSGANQNINVEIVAGMQATVLPSHRCGLIMAGKPLFMAMPRLPDYRPYDSAISTDPDSGASIRMYYGNIFGQNMQGTVHDLIFGKTLASDYAMMLALPV